MNLIRILYILLVLYGFSACKNKTDRTDNSTEAKVTSDAAAEKQPTLHPDMTLHEAAFSGDLDACKALIESGADVNNTNSEGHSSLMLAAFNGHSEIVGELIKNGAEVNISDNQGLTPLHFAASGPYPETVSLLLNNGSAIDATDQIEHFTPLMYAASEGNTEVVRVLLENDADVTLTDDDGDTAETFARQNNHQNIVELLVNRK